jgi:hypothetical protein
MFATTLIGRFVVFMAALGCFAPMPLRADPADMMLLNGRIVTLDDTSSITEALAITGDRITATGSDDQMRKLAGADTTIVDLGGRTVIPGLIDSHIHLIRAGFRYANEVDWNGATSIDDALERLRSAAIQAKPGAWLIVAGGWTPRQFTESRRPTEAEIAAVASDHPVYIQLFYGSVLLNAVGRERLGIKSDYDLPSSAKFERAGDGTVNGWIVGPGAAILVVFALAQASIARSDRWHPSLYAPIEPVRADRRDRSRRSQPCTGRLRGFVPAVAGARAAAARRLQHIRAASGHGAGGFSGLHQVSSDGHR